MFWVLFGATWIVVAVILGMAIGDWLSYCKEKRV